MNERLIGNMKTFNYFELSHSFYYIIKDLEKAFR